MKTLLTLLFLQSMLITNAAAQVSPVWSQTYDGPGADWDQPTGIALDTSGNVFITGYSWGSGTGYDYTTMKYNSAGVQQWVQRYNGSGNGDDKPVAIALDAAGNVYVTGQIYEVGYNYGTIKYNNAGVQQWVRSYNGPENNTDAASAMAVDSAGNVFITGSIIGSYNWDYATIKYNTNGVLQWSKIYQGDGATTTVDVPAAIAIDDSDNVVVTGYTRQVPGTYYDYATIKYNSAGIQQWIKTYDGADDDDRATAIAIDDSCNIYVTGSSYNGPQEMATIKYNPAGVQQWLAFYQYFSGDKPTAIKVDASHNVYVTGYGYGTGHDMETVKYNSHGVERWSQRFGSSSQDEAYAMALDDSCNVYITGSAVGCSNLLKYDSSGVLKWDKSIGASTTGYGIVLDASNHIFIAGWIPYDFYTVKFTQEPVGIEDIYSEISNGYSLSQNYPNPFDNFTKIEYRIPNKGMVTIKIFDIVGNEVATLVNEVQEAGFNSVNFNADNLTNGVYYYNLQAGTCSETKKLLFIR